MATSGSAFYYLEKSTARKKYVKRVIRRKTFVSSLDDVLLPMAFFLRFLGPSTRRFAHVVLCSFDPFRGLYVRKSLMAQEGDEWFDWQGHFLDDVQFGGSPSRQPRSHLIPQHSALANPVPSPDTANKT